MTKSRPTSESQTTVVYPPQTAVTGSGSGSKKPLTQIGTIEPAIPDASRRPAEIFASQACQDHKDQPKATSKSIGLTIDKIPTGDDLDGHEAKKQAILAEFRRQNGLPEP
jgi:hypothetical protein